MRRFSRLSLEMPAKHSNEIQRKPRAKKKRSKKKRLISNIATLDNGTMVEMFKFLNYCQLAKNSLVSKKFRDLIRTHRHSLALLYVNSLIMINFSTNPSLIIFGQQLSPEAYNKWARRNGYSKWIPIDDQVVGKKSALDHRKVYELWANACYKNPNCCQSPDCTNVFYAQTKLNYKQWPLFQHFARLLMDPFVYIHTMRLIPQKHFVNLLAGAFNQDHGRLRCEKLKFKLEGNVQKFINWTKNQVRCDEIVIEDDLTSNHDQELLDLLVTGAQCTSKVSMAYSMVNGTQIVVDVVQKFLDLKSSDECQVIESIHGNTANREVVKVMRRDYDDFIPEEERDYGTEHAFDFGNSDVGKKLQLSIEIFGTDEKTYNSKFAMTIINL